MQPMNSPRYSLRALLLLLALSITACDGGIFGTGDPGIDIEDASGGTTGGNQGGTTDGGTEGGTGDENSPVGTTGGATEGDTVSVDGFAEAVPLINSVVTTERDVALVRVLNFTPDSVSLTSLGDQEGVIPSRTVSTLLSLPQTISRIEINSTIGELLLGSLDPVALASGSLSGVLIRSATTEAFIDVSAYESRASSDDEGTALVRLIAAEVANTDGAASTSTDIELVPTGEALTGTRVILTGLDYNNPVGDYSIAAVGDYSIQSGGQELAALRLEPRGSYSLVQVVDEAVRVIVDSDVD
jgi:hypothetical protein